jgi:hypothetical protein
MRRSKIVLGVALAVVAAAICVVCFWPDEGLSRPQGLRDGSVLTVKAVSFGTDHSYRETRPKPWQLAIGKRLLYALAARLGWHFTTGGSVGTGNWKGTTSMAIFTVREGPGDFPSDSLGAVVLDDQGNSLGWFGGGGGAWGIAPKSLCNPLQTSVSI